MNNIFVLIIIAVAIGICCSSTIASGAEQSNLMQGEMNAVERKGEEVSVPFVTLRNRTGDTEPSSYYGGSRGTLEAGFCTVMFSPIWGLEDIAETVPFYIPDEKIGSDPVRNFRSKN